VSGGVTVNSVTFTDPTHVTLDLNTTAASNGAKNVTITNPDGQSATTNNVIFVGAAPPSPILISEFRFQGAAGGNDEFIELYNNTNSPITVADTNGGTGYAVAGTNTTGTNSNRCTVPNGTVIPARGHFLCTNNGASGYSLGGYAAGDVNYATGIVAGGGVAVFSTTTVASWGTATRFDAVGFSGITGTTLFTEGTALLPAGGISTSGEHCFVRKMTNATGGLPQDTDNNQSDFAFVSTTGVPFNTRQSTLGAPGPENLASPIVRNNTISLTLLDPSVGSSSPPNRARDFTSDPANNSTFGTMSMRRTVTNSTGAPVTRLRFRIIDLTTFAGTVPAGTADLRARTSTPSATINITGTNPACPAGVCAMFATTLETPSAANNGGLNSSLSVGTVALGTPLVNGGTVNVEFLLGVQQTGNFRFFVNIEALP
jgi:hypothetical protein